MRGIVDHQRSYGDASPPGPADLAVALLLALLGFAFLLTFDPFERPVMFDPATWDYMSIELTRGLVPYRDVFLHKTPGAAFVGALGAAAGPLLGLSPVQGAHGLFVVLGAAGPALLYLVCRSSLGVAGAVAAAAFMMAFDQWPTAAVEGVRPKIATVTFGLACLFCAGRRSFLISGIWGALATLCWQPGLAFLVGALANCWTVEPGNRLRATVRLVLGATAPVAGLFAWLWSKGALLDLFQQAVGFNLSYIESKARGPLATLRALYRQVSGWNPVELLLLPAAVFGIAQAPRTVPAGLAVAGIVYVVMVLVSFQAWPDTILFAPFVGCMLGAGLFTLGTAGLSKTPVSVALCAVSLAAAITPVAPRLHTKLDFAEQRAQMLKLSDGLPPHYTVVAVSVPEFLIHAGKRNGWKWPYMWSGVDRFAADHTTDGFSGLLSQLEVIDPDLILIARRWSGPHRSAFRRWTRSRYAKKSVRVFPHLAPPIEVHRRLKRPRTTRGH